MKTNLKLRKALVLSLGLALTLLVPKASTAQYGGENDFFALDETVLEEYFAVDNYYGTNDFSSVLDGISNLMEAMDFNRASISIDDNDGVGISNYGIGETVPLGSGIAILLATSLGYVALKKKEEEQ